MSEQQIIDSQGRFTGGLEVPPSASASASAYRVVAVVGCQSGGKSTLLNTAFRTSFPVLDAPKSGRRRTTLGVWGAIATPPAAPALVILDVEGTDSRERGEGAVAFESRTSLFALAVADVVLVNMWAHDVGRHSAANYDLFETVFAHAAALPPPPAPVHLVVVVRDAEPDAPLSDIRRVLDGDLRNIWHALRRPPAAFDRLFHLRVVALPHRKFAPRDFERAAVELGRSITAAPPASAAPPAPAVGAPSREAPEAREAREARAHAVPLAAFETYARHVWIAICKRTGGVGADAEFTLDLPRHVALTVHFKCGEVVSGLMEGRIGGRIEELRAEIESDWRRPVPDFGTRVDAIARDAFAEYDKAAEAYGEGKGATEAVVGRRRELGRALLSRLGDVRERYLWVCRDYCMNSFEDEFRPMLGGTAGYERNAKRLANSFVARYRSLLENAKLPKLLDEYVEVKGKEEEKGSSAGVDGGGENGQAVVKALDASDMLDRGLQIAGSEEEVSVDEFSCDAFKRDVMRLVEDRRRLGELMLPGGSANFVAAAPKQDPWWKGLLIRGAILLINYLQASQGQRAAIKLHRKHEKEFPPSPTF